MFEVFSTREVAIGMYGLSKNTGAEIDDFALFL